MKQLDMSPEALNDLQQTKAYIAVEYGEEFAKKILGNIMDSIGNLLAFPDAGISMFARYGIACDYLYIVSNRNYVFYRKEGECIRVIRVLNEKQDFMYNLFGIKTTSQETEDYWEKNE